MSSWHWVVVGGRAERATPPSLFVYLVRSNFFDPPCTKRVERKKSVDKYRRPKPVKSLEFSPERGSGNMVRHTSYQHHWL